MKIALDGGRHGGYRGECECGFTWGGQAVRDSTGVASPALPIAEAVVHHRMCHDDTSLQLCFTWRFEEWLKRYWDRASFREFVGTAAMER